MLLVIYCHMAVEGRGDRYGDLTADLLRTGIVVPVQIGGQLPAPFFKTADQRRLPETDFPGWHPGGNPEYDHQLFQCTFTVIGQFFRIDRHGRLYGSQ